MDILFGLLVVALIGLVIWFIMSAPWWGWLILAVIIVLCIIIGTWISKKDKETKNQEKIRKEIETKAIKEREAKEKAERERIEKERLEHFRNGLNKNPIITTAVPAVAAQRAREMVLNQATEPYQKKPFEVYAFDNSIKVAEQFIPYAQYGLSSISDDCMRYELAKKVAEVFHQALCNELTALNTRCRTHIEHIPVSWKYFNPEYIVTCEIGFANSRSW